MELRILTGPTVRIVGRQQVDDEALGAFLRDEGVETWETDADEAGQVLAEVAGRLCYKSYARARPGGNAAYLGNILRQGHGSVLEHAVYSFIIAGVSRSFSHELVRHRAGFSYSQRSQRFCDETGGAFVVPRALKREVEEALTWAALVRSRGFHNWDYRDLLDGLREDKLRAAEAPEPGPAILAGLLWLASVEQSQAAYARLSNYLVNRAAEQPDLGFAKPMSPEPREARKPAREAARSLLPNATETQIFVTANARALRHFIEARGGPEADAEIRAVAVAMLQILNVEAPNIFGDYGLRYLDNGHQAVAMSAFHKV